MITVDSVIRRGKWLFKYPARIWWGMMVAYSYPLIIVNVGYYSVSVTNKVFELYLETPLGALGLIIILVILAINILTYSLFFTKWKQWAFENVDDPKEFVREAIRNHFYITQEELGHLRRVETVHAPL